MDYSPDHYDNSVRTLSINAIKQPDHPLALNEEQEKETNPEETEDYL